MLCLSLWFFHNIGMTFFNKSALKTINLPATLTLFHMVCNSIGAYLYIHVFHLTKRKELTRRERRLLFYFSFIFLLNIISGNWSLALVSISFNQVMRALVPGATLVTSMIFLKKKYSLQRKLCLIPIALGIMLVCGGETEYSFFGIVVTSMAVLFAAIKSVLSNKFLTGELELHPMDLILHQAPLSACWCCFAILFNGEFFQLQDKLGVILPQLHWFLFTGVLSFSMNATSFFANQATSALSLAVCANIKQIVVILLSIVLFGDSITLQKSFGIIGVVIGGALYSYFSFQENKK